MTSHPLPPHDENDDQDLRTLYRSLPRTEPSAKLDAAVKQAAARAAAADRNVQQPRRRWHPGWGVAATVVLATSLFFLTEVNHPDVARLPEAPPVDATLTPPPETVQRDAPKQVERRMRFQAPAPARAPAPTSELSSKPRPVTPSAESSSDQSLTTTTAPPAAESTAIRITHIRTLLQQGQREKALQALRDLQRDKPGVTLPADLQRLLPKQP